MRIVLLAGLVAACDGGPAEPTDTPPPATDTDVTGGTGFSTGDCGSTAPSIDAIAPSNGGIDPSRCGGFPMALFALTLSDADGDLHRVRFEGWTDGVVDGAVNTSGEVEVGNTTDLENVDPCEVSAVDPYTISLCVEGSAIPYNAHLEVAWVVYDAQNNASAPAVVDFWSPTEDGSPGGPPATTGDTGP